jgi:hypothetical protein
MIIRMLDIVVKDVGFGASLPRVQTPDSPFTSWHVTLGSLLIYKMR